MWKVVKEGTMPSEGEEVFMYTEEFPTAGVMVGSYKGDNTWGTPRGIVTGTISHWQAWGVHSHNPKPPLHNTN
jgi:hypothetical protein